MQETLQNGPQASPPEAFKLDIGRILNLVGISFLVIGAVLLLGYSWLHLGADFKIGLGALLASALVVGGNYLVNTRPQTKWFGQGLIGGGYALGYFVVYAMQNIASVKIIDNPILDLVLLLILSMVAMQHALVKKSQVSAILVSALATLTISLNPVTLFSVASCAILATALSYAIWKMRWFGLYAFNTILSYATYTFFTSQHISFATDPQITLLIAMCFLSVIWFTNTICNLALAEDGRKGDLLATMSVFNSIAFVLLGAYCLSGVFAGYRFIFLNLVGAFYARTSRLFKTRPTDLSTLHKFTGLAFVTAAVPLEQISDAVPVILLLEVALLSYAGLKYNQLSMRAFAGVLAAWSWLWVVFKVFPSSRFLTMHSITYSVSLEWPLYVGLLGVACYCFSMWCYRLPQFAAVKRIGENFMPTYFCICASAMALLVPTAVATNPLAVMVWPAFGLALIAAGFRFKDKSYRITGLLFFGLVAYKLLIADLLQATTIQRSLSFFLAGIAFLLGSSAYAWLGNKISEAAAPNNDEQLNA
jgi:uncharacterized membrane protein